MWLLRQQRRRAQRRNEEVCASLSVRLIDGSLYIAYGGTLIHKSSLPIGITLMSIGGEEVVFDGSNIDTDVRFGCIAYGIKPKKV